MSYFANQLCELNIPVMFDPGQKTSQFNDELLLDVIRKSYILIVNKGELIQIKNKTNLVEEELMNYLKAIIITKGADGSTLIYKNEKNETFRTNIQACIPEKDIVDTTGAGDGYRAGVLTGLVLHMSLIDACRLGSVIGSFIVETEGAQTQFFQKVDELKRFSNTYSHLLLQIRFYLNFQPHCYLYCL